MDMISLNEQDTTRFFEVLTKNGATAEEADGKLVKIEGEGMIVEVLIFLFFAVSLLAGVVLIFGGRR